MKASVSERSGRSTSGACGRERVEAVDAARADADDARADVARAGDVVGRVADDDELVRLKPEAEVAADAFAREARQVAAVVRVVAEGAGQA